MTTIDQIVIIENDQTNNRPSNGNFIRVNVCTRKHNKIEHKLIKIKMNKMINCNIRLHLYDCLSIDNFNSSKLNKFKIVI